MKKNKLLSLVIPVHNEYDGIDEFHDTILIPALNLIKNIDFEIIYVNDGSTDNSLGKLNKLAENDSRLVLLNLSKNFGKEIATTAGIFQSSGDAVIMLDADGQHPPELIKDFITKWKAGAQVVVGIRKSNQKEGLIKHFGSKAFYKIFNNMNSVSLIPGSTDFRLITKEVREEFVKCPEQNRITRGLIDWLGFTRDYIYFDSPPRIAGEATYKTSQLIKLALNSFVSMSPGPLLMLMRLGIFIVLASIVIGLFIFIEQILMLDPLELHFSGSFMLGVFISFLVGILIVTQSIVALYISHIHTQTQGRPLFIIDKTKSKNFRK